VTWWYLEGQVKNISRRGIKKMFSFPPPRHFLALFPLGYTHVQLFLSQPCPFLTSHHVYHFYAHLILPQTSRQESVGSYLHYHATWNYMPDDSALHSYHHQNLKSHTGYFTHNLFITKLMFSPFRH
jgi:hypothetical protein